LPRHRAGLFFGWPYRFWPIAAGEVSFFQGAERTSFAQSSTMNTPTIQEWEMTSKKKRARFAGLLYLIAVFEWSPNQHLQPFPYSFYAHIVTSRRT